MLHVTLDRPDAGNALNATLIDELIAVFEAIRDDRSVRAVVLRGAGKHFCVGADLREVGDLDAADRHATTAHNRRFGQLLATIDGAPQAVIVLATNAALGGGFGLLCVADVTIVTTALKTGMPEARLGLPAAQILPFVVARLGMAEARRLGVTAADIDAGEALRLGIAHHIVDHLDDGETQLAAVVANVLRCGPAAIAETKRIIADQRNVDMDQVLDQGAAVFTDCLFDGEGVEGTRAFLDKRAPRWADT
ncbi:enoyl-CoA hydratase/isomerase [Salinisphaera sp. T31B1]